VQRFSAEMALTKNFRLALLDAGERFGNDAGGASEIRTDRTVSVSKSPAE
jgi:hypothetical protein